MAEPHADELTLLAYVDGELAGAEQDALEEHLEACSTCAAEARRLEAGRDALRASPLLELSEERRRAILASLPARKETWSFLAPLRRLGPALPAAAALLLVATVAALATQLPRGGDGASDEAAGEAGQALEEPAADTEEKGRATVTEDALGPAEGLADEPVARVEGPPGEVAALLRRSGREAAVRDGSVVVVGKAEEIRSVLAGRRRGPVPVYANAP